MIDTHTRAEHITSAGLIRKRTGAKAIAGTRSAPCADIQVREGDHIRVGGLTLHVLDTPGHTDDSVSLRCEGRVSLATP